MPRGRYQQKQWEDREAAILDALEALSDERGFANVTMDDLADAVGISKATLYQHFDSKDAMLGHLIARQEDQFIEWLQRIADQPPVDRLLDTMRYLMEGHISPLRGVVSMGREEVMPVFRSSPALIERHDQIIASLTATIQEGQSQGSIGPDLTPRVVISAMLALSNVSMGDYEPPECTRNLNSEAGYGEQMMTLFARSLRPSS